MKLGRDFQDAAACWRGGDGDGRPAGVEFKFSQNLPVTQIYLRGTSCAVSSWKPALHMHVFWFEFSCA